MKYFVGYLIQGDAARWHVNTAKGISEKFNTWKIYEKIPPHVTIFYLDHLEDISKIRNYISGWVQNNKVTGSFQMNGFDHFEDKVVFAKVDADESVVGAVKDLRKGIGEVSGLSNEEFSVWHPHATLANRLNSEEINNIWDYTTQIDKPDFTFKFNNITIFKYMGDKVWAVDESFELQ